jgi:hypothetical protein
LQIISNDMMMGVVIPDSFTTQTGAAYANTYASFHDQAVVVSQKMNGNAKVYMVESVLVRYIDATAAGSCQPLGSQSIRVTTDSEGANACYTTLYSNVMQTYASAVMTGS